MQSEHHRQLVWDSLLDTDFKARYFGHLAGRLQRRERLLTVAVTILSSGAFVTLIGKLGSAWLPQVFSLLAAVTGAVLAVYKLGKTASLSASLHAKACASKYKLEALWAEIDTLAPQDVLRRWEAIEADALKDDETAAAEFTIVKSLAEDVQAEVMRVRRLAAT